MTTPIAFGPVAPAAAASATAASTTSRTSIVPAVALAAHLETLSNDADAGLVIDLMAIPAERWQAQPIHLQASLQEAWERFENDGVEALVVQRMNAPGISRSYGVLLPEMVERAYRY